MIWRCTCFLFFLLIINYCHCAAAHLAPFAGERYNFCCFLVWGNAQISPLGCSELIHHSISCCSPQCKATQAHAQGSKRRSDVSQPFLNIKQATPNILEYTKTSRINTSFLFFMYMAAPCRFVIQDNCSTPRNIRIDVHILNSLQSSVRRCCSSQLFGLELQESCR